jgi:selenide,water dikinase
LYQLSDGSFSVKLYLINRGNNILSSHCQAVRNIVCRLLREKDIDVHLGAEICHVEHFKESEDVNAMESRICLISTAGSRFYCDDVIWCTEAKGQVGNWLRETSSVKLACDEGGFVMVKPTLQSISIPNIFAAGDICNNLTYPRPKAGKFRCLYH